MPSEYSYAARVDDDGVVRQVISIPYMDDSDLKITAYCNSIGLDGLWMDTSFNASRRGKFASTGDKYDAEQDIFYDPEL